MHTVGVRGRDRDQDPGQDQDQVRDQAQDQGQALGQERVKVVGSMPRRCTVYPRRHSPLRRSMYPSRRKRPACS